jgi:hypothetical protein
LANEIVKVSSSAFSIRVRLGEYEVEISGNREDVLKTVEDLPNIVANVSKAFEPLKGKVPTASLTIKASKEKPAIPMEEYPKIPQKLSCSKAILQLLESEWGKWRPRTLAELEQALKANSIHYPTSTLSSVLRWLARRGKVRRWKTDAGYVYILAEKEEL